jgi:glycosyltransferase involved in cell wall biosynthesis
VAPSSLEAILVPDERTREQLENRQPDTIGRVWATPETVEQRDTLVDYHYPISNTSYRLGLVGYNLKFAKPIVTDLLKNPGVDALIDEWRFFAAAPTGVTDQVLEEADVVWCEWCGPNAVYASHNKAKDQMLIVRLHRFELDTEHWQNIDPENVDTFVTVGDYYRNLVLERTRWPADKVMVIPNQIDDLQLSRPKLPEARFTLGMLGASSSRKRLDLALDLIEQLNAADERFRLRVKTALPQDEKWVWDDAAERSYFGEQLPRIEQPPLAGIVTLDPFGPDVASWLRRIGFILSLSDDESFHLAPAEGMAAATVPIIRNWPGADSVYSGEWVFRDLEAMADRIAELVRNESQWTAAGLLATEQARASFSQRSVVRQWDQLLGKGPGDSLQ